MGNNTIFEFIYELAFKDATIRKAFPKNIDEEDEHFRQRKQEAYNSLKESTKEYLDSLLDKNKQANPEEYILRICREGKQYGFTFGNAQKLINMTAKYMFVICYDEPEKKARFKDCHCPMDGIMIQILKGYGKCKDIAPDFPWSRMKSDGKSIPKEYQIFQNDVRSLCKAGELPLEYDFEQWGKKSYVH